MILKRNNLIKVLPGLGSEFKIIFDLLITKVLRNRWLNVLLFTADTGLNGQKKYGDRIPSLFVHNDRLYVFSAVSGNPNYYQTVPTTVGKWMKIEICQHEMNNKGQDIFINFSIYQGLDFKDIYMIWNLVKLISIQSKEK